MFLEIFSVFLPCWQAYRHQALRQETLDMITAWESRYTYNDPSSGLSRAENLSRLRTDSSSYLEKPSIAPSTVHSEESLFSMSALERVLAANPEPLRQFSALKDFSGENVVFLTAVAEWKSNYPVGQGDEAARGAYVKALDIFTKFISPRYAEFPINISFQEMSHFEAMFEKAAKLLYGDTGLVNDSASPFMPSDGSWLPSFPSTPVSQKPMVSSNASIHELRSSMARLSYWGDIPADFGPTCFDQAERSIKYLVLTNTWPKFLRSSASFQTQDLSPQENGKSWSARIAGILSCEV